jgi:Lon protease-like protein
VHRLATALALLATILPRAVAGEASALRVSGAPLPSDIPLFPLPEVVLFPGARRPLVIYEPRYRDMVADALMGNRIIGTVLLRPGFEANYEGRPPIYAIGCAGVIEDYQRLPDGRYAILLHGLTTFRVVREDQRKPYRRARVEAIPEVLKDEDRASLSMLRERLARLLDGLLPLDVKPPDPSLEDDEFVNVTAQALEMPEASRQELLENNNVVGRARGLVERLSK